MSAMILDVRATRVMDWIRTQAAPAHGLLIPISGGSDSALCFRLLNLVYPEKTLAVYEGDKLRCREWFEQHGKVLYVEPITLEKPLSKRESLALRALNPSLSGTKLDCGQLVLYNAERIWRVKRVDSAYRYTLEARPEDVHRETARWTKFINLSLTNNQWLVGSRNRTEEALGTYSMISRIATFLPLAGVWKSDVIDLCQKLGVPQEIIDSSRQADPDCGRPPEMSEIPLELVDVFLQVQVGELPAHHFLALTAAQRQYLHQVYQRNRFKSSLPARGPLIS